MDAFKNTAVSLRPKSGNWFFRPKIYQTIIAPHTNKTRLCETLHYAVTSSFAKYAAAEKKIGWAQ